MTTWQELIINDADGSPAFVQIAAPADADAWAQYALDQSSDGMRAAVSAQTWAQQKAHVRRVFDAIAYAYQCANVPPIVDPVYRAAFLDTFGATFARSHEDAAAHRIRAIGAGGTYGGSSRFRTMIAARYTALQQQPPVGVVAGDVYRICDIIVRVLLTEQATVVTQCFEGLDEASPLCDFHGAFRMCTTGDGEGTASNACDGYNWGTLAWIPGRWLNPLDADRNGCAILRALPPLVWHLDFAHAIASAFVQRGARRVIEDARINATATNAATALRLGLLSGELAERATRLSADFADAPLTNENKRNAVLALQTAASLVTAAGSASANPYVTAAGAILGIAAAVYSITPDAIGLETDEFGRGVPVFEVGQISGGASLAQPPRQSPPEPPSGARAGRSTGLATSSVIGPGIAYAPTFHTTETATNQALVNAPPPTPPRPPPRDWPTTIAKAAGGVALLLGAFAIVRKL